MAQHGLKCCPPATLGLPVQPSLCSAALCCKLANVIYSRLMPSDVAIAGAGREGTGSLLEALSCKHSRCFLVKLSSLLFLKSNVLLE